MAARPRRVSVGVERLMRPDHPSPEEKLAETLERDRLVRRERRLELVVRELRVRAEARRAGTGRVPEPLGRALAHFQSELRSVRAALRTR
jgi:hypothetical protein